MSKKHKSIYKRIKKRIKNPKYGHFHIRKSLIIGLLTSCGILLSSTYSLSYADSSTNLLLKNHFQKHTEQVKDTEQMMSDVLSSVKEIQRLEQKYTETIQADLKETIGKLSKGEIAEKLAIVTEKIKNISYDQAINDTNKKEELAQLLALKEILYGMYDHNHYAKNVDISNLLK